MTEETKICEQCQHSKPLSAFHRRKNKTDGRMRICAECYMANYREQQRKMAEELERLKREQEEREKEREAQRWAEEERNQAHQHTLEMWYQQQPDRQCIVCKQLLPASDFGYSLVVASDDGTGWIPKVLYKRCKSCHEEYRKNNRRCYPLCQLCSTPKRDFLGEYRGYRLDIISVCCTDCIPRFETLPESTQMEWLSRAMIKTYGETAVIYGLSYDESGTVHHTGRTKHYKRRMADYRRNWDREVKSHQVLEELSFGPLSMERESRWMLHALKHGWPIDNFELLKIGEDGLGGIRLQTSLTQAVQSFEPLTSPFETIAPLLSQFSNTHDAHIIHWFVEQIGLS